MNNRKLPPVIQQILKYSENLIPIEIEIKDDDPIYKVGIPGKFGTISVRDTGHAGLEATTRYDTTLPGVELEDFYDMALESVRVAMRYSSPHADPVKGLSDGWIKIGIYLNRIEEVATVIYKTKP
jgi:hypothetical protein